MSDETVNIFEEVASWSIYSQGWWVGKDERGRIILTLDREEAAGLNLKEGENLLRSDKKCILEDRAIYLTKNNTVFLYRKTNRWYMYASFGPNEPINYNSIDAFFRGLDIPSKDKLLDLLDHRSL